MTQDRDKNETNHFNEEPYVEGRDQYEMDIDRMVNEGLGGGYVSLQDGLIDDSTTDYMEKE